MAKDNKILIYIVIGFLVIYLLTKKDDAASPPSPASKVGKYKHRMMDPYAYKTFRPSSEMMSKYNHDTLHPAKLADPVPVPPPPPVPVPPPPPVPTPVHVMPYTMSNPMITMSAPYKGRRY
jgi:hypothetical protein